MWNELACKPRSLASRLLSASDTEEKVIEIWLLSRETQLAPAFCLVYSLLDND